MILIVDDDRSITTSLALLLKHAGYRSTAVSSPAEALGQIERGDLELVLQDMNFSRATTGEEGLELLRRIRAKRPALPVILITAWGTIELAVQGMRAGAADFVTKPWINPQILQSVQTALSLSAAGLGEAGAQPRSRAELDSRFDFGAMIGEDPRILKILDLVARVSATDASVLITGESGSGKECVAEIIHRNSHRRRGPFVKVNAGGIPPGLFESEMFGHVRGAFTDARTDRKGRFEMADKGTIFLDEVGDLDPCVQVKLLRVLQDRSYEVLGSSATRTTDVRVVSATNRNLAEMVEQGRFREDLFFRLNLIAVHMPPLRERTGDIPLLARHFVEKLAVKYRREPLAISNAALEWLQGMPWPGNVRQLGQVIERAMLVSGSDRLDVGDLLAAAEMEQSRQGGPRPLPEVGSMSLEEIEKAMILKALKHHEGHITRAAEALGLTRAALYRRMEKFGIRV